MPIFETFHEGIDTKWIRIATFQNEQFYYEHQGLSVRTNHSSGERLAYALFSAFDLSDSSTPFCTSSVQFHATVLYLKI